VPKMVITFPSICFFTLFFYRREHRVRGDF
jgi:hypothetical protein